MLAFEPIGRATRMRWSWTVRPRGLFRLFTPLVGLMGRRQELAIWTNLKSRLEAGVPKESL